MKQTPILLGLALIFASAAIAAQDNSPVSAKWSDNSNWASYEDPSYGFAIRYPKDIVLEKTFHGYYLASDIWRIELDRNTGVGKPLLSIPLVQAENKTGLYYTSELRIGVSSDPVGLKNCYSGTSGAQEINGMVFRVRKFSDQAMMQYLQGVSYRIIHNDQCFAIEQLKSGSVPQDENQMQELKKLVTLENSYPSMDSIVQTFKFID